MEIGQRKRELLNNSQDDVHMYAIQISSEWKIRKHSGAAKSLSTNQFSDLHSV